MSFGRNLISLRENHGISRKDLAKQLDIPYTTLRNYETDKREPGHNLLIQIARIFSVTVDSLIGVNAQYSNNASPGLPDEAIKVAHRYNKLDTFGKSTVLAVVQEEENRIKAQAPAPPDTPAQVVYIKRNDLKASAGDGFMLDEESTEDLAVLYNDVTRRADFCVEVQGDSMEPKLHDGDWILVRQQPSVDVGQIGLFMVNDSGYVKEQGEGCLISLNPDYDDIYPTEFTTVRCAGLVLGVLDPDWIVDE